MSNVKQYRKKPVVVEAVQWDTLNADEISRWSYNATYQINDHQLCVSTLEGSMVAEKDDWIIRGVKGEFYPCKPDIFEMTYEEAPCQSN